MNELLLGLLIGAGVGLIISPIIIFIFIFFKNVFMRRKIKKMLKKGKFLVTIDKRDYDYEKWTNQKYGNIDWKENEKELKDLNSRIFKKRLTEENKNKINLFIKENKDKGVSDDEIKEEFKKKNYSDEEIKEFMNGK